MPSRPITHSRWLRGLQAGFDRYSLPKGSVSRISNMVYTRRGALKVCDGSFIFTLFNNTLQNAFGPITEVFLFQPTGQTVSYYGIAKDLGTHIGAPTGLAAATGASGALTGAYKYVITALDGAGGETTASNEASVTLTAQKGALSWTVVANAAGGYNVYRTVAGGGAGTEHFVATVAGQATNSYVDNTADGSLGPGVPPVSDNTQVIEFYNFITPSYSAANIIKTLPADNIPFNPGGGGGGGGGGSGGGNPNGGGAGAGGVTGNTGPLPMIVQFTNKMVLALGNGITPYLSDGTSGGTTQITNTFSATYPAWAASTTFLEGDQIQVTISSVVYVFTAVQGGESGSGSPPSFSATLGSTVADGTIIWKNSGQATGSPPPRGAAHAEVYAGSLWVANTDPAVSSDQLDGPSAIRMSDLNNPLSWNPLNSAQISPDDADQCTGIKAFTVAEAGIAPQNFLMYFKNFSSYLIQGVFGATDFAITRLQTDLGSIAPRSIQFLPGYGIMRLSHLGFAVTDGISDKLQDPEAIRPYLFPESTETDITSIDQSYLYFAKAAQTANPPMYVCAVPLLGTPFALQGVSMRFTGKAPSSGQSWTPGSWYFKVQANLSGGQTLVTGEFSLVAPPTNSFGFAAVQLTLPSVPGATSYDLFWGTSPGQENLFMQLPSSAGGGTNVFYKGQFTVQSGSPTISGGGALTRLFCYDLVIKAWTVVDLPFGISVLKQTRVPGSLPVTVMAGFFDGAIRRWQGGDTMWDAGATNANNSQNVNWSFRDAEVAAEGGTVLMFHNQVIIRGDGGPLAINVQPEINGTFHSTVVAALLALGNNQYEARARILKRAENLNLTISGSGPAVVESINYESNVKKVGASLIIA